MPRAKKSNDLFLDEFPALTRLLEEITLHREKERVQPRLPFAPLAGDHNKPQRESNERRKKRF